MPPTSLPPPMTASRQQALARLEQRMRNQFGSQRERTITAKDRARLIEMARIMETQPASGQSHKMEEYSKPR
jgi:hypothetical protein